MRRWVLAFAFVLSASDVSAQPLTSAAIEPVGSSGSTERGTSGHDVPGPSRFRSGIDLVALNVIVTDAHHALVPGLTANDFTVFEDRVQQDLSFFAATQVPLDLAILLDTSSSMRDRIRTVQRAAVGFASALRPGDRVSVLDIKGSVATLHPLNGDIAAACDAIRRTVAKGDTALYNGVYLALREMAKGHRDNGEVRRQALVVLSDGDDTASLVSADDVMEAARQAGVVIYTITLQPADAVQMAARNGYRYFSRSEYTMKALAQDTGGRAFSSTSVSELAGVYGLITRELASHYILGYTSKNPKSDGSFRRVMVRVPGMQTRTRSGYVATRTGRPTSSR